MFGCLVVVRCGLADCERATGCRKRGATASNAASNNNSAAARFSCCCCCKLGDITYVTGTDACNRSSDHNAGHTMFALAQQVRARPSCARAPAAAFA